MAYTDGTRRLDSPSTRKIPLVIYAYLLAGLTAISVGAWPVVSPYLPGSTRIQEIVMYGEREHLYFIFVPAGEGYGEPAHYRSYGPIYQIQKVKERMQRIDGEVITTAEVLQTGVSFVPADIEGVIGDTGKRITFWNENGLWSPPNTIRVQP